MLDAWRRRIARAIAPKTISKRTYAGAKQSRLTGGFGSYGNTSADAELESSLPLLRARSRQLMRDAPYAKRARVVVVNNVIGAGVGLQAQVKNTRGELHTRVNDSIEGAWKTWCKAGRCHTGGAMHFSDMERAGLSEVFTTGELFVRLHPRAFGDSQVPLGLELIEAERLAEGYSSPEALANGNDVRMGVEVDRFQRAIAYWIRERHPGDNRGSRGRSDKLIRVPAEEMLHVRLVDRWPMVRGEPWLHTVLRKMNDMEEYSASELQAARLSANYFATLKTPELDSPLPTETGDDGATQMNIEGGTIDQLPPGTELDFHAPNRPNTALDPFLRYMLREVAAGTGVSYESISRDYSQSNYSSSRLSLLEDRDLWRVLQAWWVRSFREPLHCMWMRQAVLAGAIPAVSVSYYALNTEAACAVRWKLRGWSWVDPTKEVAAFKEAVKGGFLTVSQVIAQTGGGVDLEDVIAERKQELEMFDEAGIKVDTTVTEVPVAAPAAVAPEPADPAEPGDENGDPIKPKDGVPARVVSIGGRNA